VGLNATPESFGCVFLRCLLRAAAASRSSCVRADRAEPIFIAQPSENIGHRRPRCSGAYSRGGRLTHRRCIVKVGGMPAISCPHTVREAARADDMHFCRRQEHRLRVLHRESCRQARTSLRRLPSRSIYQHRTAISRSSPTDYPREDGAGQLRPSYPNHSPIVPTQVRFTEPKGLLGIRKSFDPTKGNRLARSVGASSNVLVDMSADWVKAGRKLSADPIDSFLATVAAA
jgi:hypothetical protein